MGNDDHFGGKKFTKTKLKWIQIPCKQFDNNDNGRGNIKMKFKTDVIQEFLEFDRVKFDSKNKRQNTY